MIVAVNEKGERKSFSPYIWELIQGWENQGGWKQVKDAPKEAVPDAGPQLAESTAPRTPKKARQ